MHAAPSVNYPVGRSAFAARLYGGCAAAGLAAALAWSVQPALVWRQVLALFFVLACGAIAWRAWLRSPVGILHWDGLAWSWEEGGRLDVGRPDVALDLQQRLLLRWRGEGGRVRWLWIERASDVSHWDALRRAVYSRASTQVHAAGQPPAAEQ